MTSNTEPLQLPDNCIDVTARELDTPVAIVGARAMYLAEISTNPRFKEAPKSEQAVVIVAARKP